jgi:hypothetical protein
MTRLQAALTRHGCAILSADQLPSAVPDYAAIRDTALVLSALLAVPTVGALANMLLTGMRRRQPGLAVLKTLGLRRLQLLTVASS